MKSAFASRCRLSLPALLLIGGLAATLQSCAAPRRSTAVIEATGPSAPIAAPSWSSMETSWRKLGMIEAWLERTYSGDAPYWHLEGKLQLAEGRLSFARQDVAAAGGSNKAVVHRIIKAQIGFEAVLAASGATADQRVRATRGLREAKALSMEPLATDARGNQGHLGPILSRAQWGARSPNTSRLDPVGGNWTRITIHHSAEPNPPRLSGSIGDSASALQNIQSAHMNGEDYGDIGYHYLIDPFGRVFAGRDTRYQGAHAGGQNNVRNLGICLLGNFEHQRPTSQALAALQSLVDNLRRTHGIRADQIRAHLDYKKTQCPGKHLLSWVRRYR